MRHFRRETAFYLFAFLLALIVRLVMLGASPLTDQEAKWALQALGVEQGLHPALGPQPAYVLFTAVLFFLYGGSTNFLARLIPALTGSALVFVPWLFQARLKPRPSVILAFCFALEPGLVALSRQAGSAILAITFLLFAWGLWEHKKMSWMGIFAGLALLSGPMLWAGLLALGLTWAIRQGLERGAHTQSDTLPTRSEWLTALWFALGTIILGGTLFFISPNGLGAWLSALPVYVIGWIQTSGIPAGLMLFSLLAYQPLAIILALIATVRGWAQGSLRVKRLSIWALVALLLALFYPSHQVGDLAWMLIPLWALAALEIARNLNIRREERGEVLGVVTLSVLILAFIWFNFLALMETSAGAEQSNLRTWLLFGAFFLLVISILLVAVGWSLRSTRFGAVWGLIAVLSVYSFGMMTGAAGVRALPDAVDMWRPGGNLPESDLLLKTIDETSDWSNKNIDSQAVTITGIDSPALEWLLRGHTVITTGALDLASSPSIVITTDQDQSNPTLSAVYRGQSFVWRQDPLWNQTGFVDWMHWTAFHQIPENPEKVIVWVRGDLFIDSTAPKP